MDNDEIISQFDDLEEKVEFLIELCKTLEITNKDLQTKIDSLEDELKGKTETENRHSEQRTLVRSKIDSLLSKLSNFSEIP